jgi:hypothetical protein
MKQQAMPGQSADHAVDGGGFSLQVPGRLSVSHAAGDLGEQFRKEIWLLEPVGCREGLGAEGELAVEAGKPLDTLW